MQGFQDGNIGFINVSTVFLFYTWLLPPKPKHHRLQELHRFRYFQGFLKTIVLNYTDFFEV